MTDEQRLSQAEELDDARDEEVRNGIRSGLWFGFSDFGEPEEEPNQCIDPERCGDDCNGSCQLYNYDEEER